MPEDPITLLQRAAELIAPPTGAFERTVQRRARMRRNSRLASAMVAVVVFAGGLGVLIRAFNGSATLDTQPTLPPAQGVAPKRIGSVQMLRAFGSKEAVALSQKAVIRTGDGGLHWIAVTPPGFGELASATMFYLDARHGWIVGLPKAKDGSVVVFRTADRGRSWSHESIALRDDLDFDSLAPGHAQPPEFGFSDQMHGWMHLPVAPSPLLVTSDGGATWQSGPLIDDQPDQIQGMMFTSPTDGWAVREHDIPLGSSADIPVQSLYRTRDGGKTWVLVDLPPPPVTLPIAHHESATELGLPTFFGPSDGAMAAWVGSKDSRALFAYVTHDGGATWTARDPIPVHQGAGSPIFTTTFASASSWVVASTSGELAVSTDAGRSWVVRDVRGLRPHGYPAGLEFTSARSGWAMVCDSWWGSLAGPNSCTGSYALYRTTDGGVTWSLMLTDLPRSRP